MNARSDQFSPPSAPPPGLFARMKASLVLWLLSDVDLTKAHLGGEGGVSFGTHSVTVGNLITMDTQAPAAMGEIGMDASTGRIQAYIGGSARAVPGSHEVLALSGGTMTGAVAMSTNKITGLGNGSMNSQDAATVAQVQSLISGVIAPQVDVGSAGFGLIGKATVTEINALSPVAGDVVIANSSATPTAGSSDALVTGDVAEYNGTSWKKIVSASGGFPPAGTRIIVSTTTTLLASSGLTDGTDDGKIANFDGTSLSPSGFSSPSDATLVAIKGEGATAENTVLSFDGAVPTGVWRATAAAGVAHSSLTSLTSGDDHTQYALGNGRSGGQTLKGGTASGNNLVLESTSNATKGYVQIASGSDIQMAGDDEWVPATDNQGSVGSASKRFAHIYGGQVHTGDLRMQNENGAFTLDEQAHAIRVVNHTNQSAGDMLVVKPWVGALLRRAGLAV